MRKNIKRIAMVISGALAISMAQGQSSANIPTVEWDAHSLIVDGQRVMPVMGEIHFSRLPANEWREEIQKMKAGGVTIIANYVFWNHLEEVRGIYDWSGQRNLREFLEICKDENMPVILRIGPFCHGESRCGGIPDWIFETGCKPRSTDPEFLKYTTYLYRQIFSQIQGLQWKDGGPILAVQFDNEERNGDYLMALKEIALSIGYDLPFYTRTGWPELTRPVPYGEMLPLFGDYADGFWDRTTQECAGNYYKAFNFKAFRSSTAIATEQLGEQKEKLTDGDEKYPYFTCELGGGMATSYHRRPYVYPMDAYSLAVVKLGSGSNLLGYYMYHGGTNPKGANSYLNENQRTPGTNHNDLPAKTYDFQAPLGEFGQPYPHYFMLRKLHMFMQDYGAMLAPMEASFPSPQDVEKGYDKDLRWSYRTDGESAFVFVNNYERLQNLTPKKKVQFDVCGIKFPSRPITIPADAACIFPVKVDGIEYATGQIVANRNGKIYMEQLPGIPTEIKIDGKILKNLKPQGLDNPVYKNIYLLTSEQAERLFLDYTPEDEISAIDFSKIKEASPNVRKISIGVRKVAESPEDPDFADAAVYSINIPTEKENKLMSIEYSGDVARLYADGELVADNFYNGRPFLFGLWRLPKNCKNLELRILPLQENMPVYLPREAHSDGQGECVTKISLKEMAKISIASN